MRSAFTALGVAFALTFGGSSFPTTHAESDTSAPVAVEDRNIDGAYLVVTMALAGLAALAGITRRDHVNARRRERPREEPIEAAPATTSAVIIPVEPSQER